MNQSKVTPEHIKWVVEEYSKIAGSKMTPTNWRQHLKFAAIVQNHPNDVHKPGCTCYYPALTKNISAMWDQYKDYYYTQYNTQINADNPQDTPSIASTTQTQVKRGRPKKQN